MQVDTYQLKIIFLNPILGSQPTRDVASTYIAGRHGMSLPEDEIETLPDALERGTTVFHKDKNDKPLLWDYQIKGFLKAAGQALNGPKNVSGIKNLKSKVSTYVYVSPRLIPIAPPNGDDIRDLIDYLERPLRAQTAMGDRVALARSEMLPEGCTVKVGIEVIAGEISEAVLRDLLDFGYYNGIGQWRGGGWGKFRYELVKED